MTIGERIKQARETAGLTQQRLADALGIRSSGIQRISSWETGERTPNRANVGKLADALGVSPAWLEYGVDPRQ